MTILQSELNMIVFLSRRMVANCHRLKKREGVPELGTKPLKALRGYRASSRGSENPIEALKGSNRGSRGSNRGSKNSRKAPGALRGSNQELPRQTKPKKGPKPKVHEFRPFLWILVFFLGKTSTIHIELLFRNAPAKSSWTDLSLVWFAGATTDLRG